MQNVKVDVFGGVVWGQGQKKEFRVPSSAEAQERVLAELLETPLRPQHRNPLDWAVSVVIHAIVLAAVLMAPLLFTQGIDLRNLELTYLVAPAPPPPPSPPPLLRAARTGVQNTRPVKAAGILSRLVAPSRIAAVVHDAEAPPEPTGVVGGVPGGIQGGVLNGIIGGTGTLALPTPSAAPPVEKQPKETLHVGGDVKPPRELFKPQPRYPSLARAAHIQGTVLIDATIDEHGNVVNAQAMEGPALLIPEALRTVMLWKYEPTYLNGVAYPVSLTVTVSFAFG